MRQLEWQEYGIIGAIIIVMFFIIKKVFFNKETDINTQVSRLIIEGIRFDKNKEYQTALYYFKKVLSLTEDNKTRKEVFFAVAGCYMKLKKYKDAVIYCERSLDLDLEDNLVALHMKIHCLLMLGRKKEYLQDLILFNTLKPNNTNVAKIKEVMDKIVTEESMSYCSEHILSFSNLKYSDFFDTLIGILPLDEDDEIVYLIKHKEYKKLDEIFFTPDQTILKSIESQEFSSNNKYYNRTLIHACLNFLKGNIEQAIYQLKNSSSEFDILFLEYLKSLKNSEEQIPDILLNTNILNSKNPTFIYYLAKIYYNCKDYDNYLYNICKLLDFPFAFADLLNFFGQIRDETKFKDFTSEALDKFGNDIRILFVCALNILDGNVEGNLAEIISRMNDLESRTNFIKGLNNIEEPDKSLEYFAKATELDITYHSAYIHSCDILWNRNNEECRRLLKESLSIASCYDEVYVSLKGLLILENEDYVKAKMCKGNI